MAWTAEQRSKARHAYGRKSASAIGKELGKSRCAVIGIWWRSGLSQASGPFSEFNDNLIPPEQRKSLMDLKDGDCRWPVGEVGSPDFFFCGSRDEPGCSYCAAHRWRSLT